MKTPNSPLTSRNDPEAVQLARTRVTEAESDVERAKQESRNARKKRKEAKQAARRAKKRLRRAKEELAEARSALADVEAKLARQSRPSPSPKKRPVLRVIPKPPKPPKPAKSKSVKKKRRTQQPKIAESPGPETFVLTDSIQAGPPSETVMPEHELPSAPEPNFPG
jgi:hypothetical protein